MIASAVLSYNSNIVLKNPDKFLQNEISSLVANPPLLDVMSITLDTDVTLDYKKKMKYSESFKTFNFIGNTIVSP